MHAPFAVLAIVALAAIVQVSGKTEIFGERVDERASYKECIQKPNTITRSRDVMTKANNGVARRSAGALTGTYHSAVYNLVVVVRRGAEAAVCGCCGALPAFDGFGPYAARRRAFRCVALVVRNLRRRNVSPTRLSFVEWCGSWDPYTSYH